MRDLALGARHRRGDRPAHRAPCAARGAPVVGRRGAAGGRPPARRAARGGASTSALVIVHADRPFPRTRGEIDVAALRRAVCASGEARSCAPRPAARAGGVRGRPAGAWRRAGLRRRLAPRARLGGAGGAAPAGVAAARRLAVASIIASTVPTGTFVARLDDDRLDHAVVEDLDLDQPLLGLDQRDDVAARARGRPGCTSHSTRVPTPCRRRARACGTQPLPAHHLRRRPPRRSPPPAAAPPPRDASA